LGNQSLKGAENLEFVMFSTKEGRTSERRRKNFRDLQKALLVSAEY
jgi:hypothetical protein